MVKAVVVAASSGAGRRSIDMVAVKDLGAKL
jgi:hypothetical protein